MVWNDIPANTTSWLEDSKSSTRTSLFLPPVQGVLPFDKRSVSSLLQMVDTVLRVQDIGCYLKNLKMGSVINMYPKCADWAWSGVKKRKWTCSWRKGSTAVPFFESVWIYSEGCVIFYNLLHVPSTYPVVKVDDATPKGWLSKGPW